jgi:hypothetical protein
MTTLTLTRALLSAGFIVTAASAFAQSTPAQKQPTQEGGATGVPCNLVANPTADPDCKNYKQRTQNLSPSPEQGMASKPK